MKNRPITLAMMKVPTNEKIVTAPAAMNWCSSRFHPPYLPPPPYRMPSFASALVPVVLKKPMHSVPIQPPTRCTPTTSSESS